jgi:uncharacterized protein
MLGNDTDLLLWMIPLLAVAGIAGGMLAGLLGVGGGIVVVPALYYIFTYIGIDPAVKMHLAVGTSLATIVPTSIRSVRAHQQRGGFDKSLFKSWAPAIVIGVVIGTFLASRADVEVLTAVFGVVGFSAALYMALGNPEWRFAEQLPKGLVSLPIPVFIGTVSSMMGIGGGTISVPALTLFGTPIHKAVGTSAGFGVVIAVPGFIGFIIAGWNAPNLPPYSAGYVSLIGFALIVPLTTLAVPWGAKLAHALSQKGLRAAFAVFLGLTSIRMLAETFGF